MEPLSKQELNDCCNLIDFETYLDNQPPHVMTRKEWAAFNQCLTSYLAATIAHDLLNDLRYNQQGSDRAKDTREFSGIVDAIVESLQDDDE